SENSRAGLAYFKPSIIAAGRLNGYIGEGRFIDFLLQQVRSSETFEQAARLIENLGETAATEEVVTVLLRAVTDDADVDVRGGTRRRPWASWVTPRRRRM